MYKNILVTVFAYNEGKTISKVIKNLSKHFKNILVVDNNSEDSTAKKAKKYNVYLIKHRYNLGKSESMKTALEFAKIKKFKYLAFMDSDGQHQTNDLKKICTRILKSKSELVIGYRNNLNNLNLKKRFGTIILQKLFYLIYKKKIFDVQSGLRIFKISIENKIYWYSTGLSHYFADAEITCNAVKNNCKIDQIPIKTIASKSSKGMNLIQGLYLMLTIFILRL